MSAQKGRPNGISKLKGAIDVKKATAIAKSKTINRWRRNENKQDSDVYKDSLRRPEDIIEEIETIGAKEDEILYEQLKLNNRMSATETAEEALYLNAFGKMLDEKDEGNGIASIIIPTFNTFNCVAAHPMMNYSEKAISDLYVKLMTNPDEECDPFFLVDSVVKSFVSFEKLIGCQETNRILRPRLFNGCLETVMKKTDITEFSNSLCHTITGATNVRMIEMGKILFAVQHIGSNIYLANAHIEFEKEKYRWLGYYYVPPDLNTS